MKISRFVCVFFFLAGCDGDTCGGDPCRDDGGGSDARVSMDSGTPRPDTGTPGVDGGTPEVDGGSDAGFPTTGPAGALARCEIREAHTGYEAAWAAAPTDGSAALRFALTDMLLLGEDPEAVQGLALFGFTSGIDSEAMFWGPEGLLDALVRHERSTTVGDYLETVFPYPPIRGEANGLDLISPSTLAIDVMVHAWAMQPRLERLVDAFELAAQTAPHEVVIDGICGLGRVELQSSELYTLASAFQGLVLVLQISRGYDWEFPVRMALDFRDDSIPRMRAQVEIFNTHLGAISDAAPLALVPDHLARLSHLLERVSTTARDSAAPGPLMLVDWPALPDDLPPAALEDALAAAELVDGPVTAPGLTPEFTGDLGPLFRGELDLASFGRSFELYEDPEWGDAWIEVQEAPIDALLTAVLTPSPFDESLDGVEIDWAHLDAWSGSDTEWSVTDIVREGGGSSFSVPGLIAPAMRRYVDVLHFE
jgi:hypothetical protein